MVADGTPMASTSSRGKAVRMSKIEEREGGDREISIGSCTVMAHVQVSPR